MSIQCAGEKSGHQGHSTSRQARLVLLGAGDGQGVGKQVEAFLPVTNRLLPEDSAGTSYSWKGLMEGAILQPLPRIRRSLVTGDAAPHKKETSTTIQYQLMGSRFTFTSFCQLSSYRIKPN
jgi:hypothetical protein